MLRPLVALGHRSPSTPAPMCEILILTLLPHRINLMIVGPENKIQKIKLNCESSSNISSEAIYDVLIVRFSTLWNRFLKS